MTAVHRSAALASLAVAAFLATVVAVPHPASAAPATLSGRVEVGGSVLESFAVTLLAVDPDGGPPRPLGSDLTGVDGRFAIEPDAEPAGRVLYLVAEAAPASPLPEGLTLVDVLGPDPQPESVVNERTTVAAAYAMARFAAGTSIAGPRPGVPNAVGMAHNLADPVTGHIGAVLDAPPNGPETEARQSFNSLANLVAACGDDVVACAALFSAATTPEGLAPTNTFEALVNVAHDPWHRPGELYAVADWPGAPNQPARDSAPDAWTLALRFWGDHASMSGPGNFAVDHEGNLWVANNYDYSPDPFQPVCGSDAVLKFDPSGRYVPGSPYTGGGLSGAGYGITVDPFGDVWVGNYGFAAVACPEQPPHNSVSQFRSDGTPVSPDTGYTQGGVSWPQGTASDQQGNIWMANCGNNSVTVFPEGDPTKARQFSDLGLTKPFDMAFTRDGTAFVTGIESSNVAMVRPDGTLLPGSPVSGIFDAPMGIAADSQGNMWVANSAVIDIPCPGVQLPGGGPGGSIALLGPDGTPGNPTPFTGGGATIPWGIAVDGNDNVWVANFAGKRVSQFCGVSAIDCRPGTSTGDAISPDGTGYGFDGLVRNTGVAIDPSGNVWVTNNWKEIPVQTNPGGYEIVAFVGLGEPVEVAAPRDRPTEPSTTTTGSADKPKAVNPRFTG